MKVLVVDIGGTSIKILATGHDKPIKIPSGPRLTPKQMVSKVKEAIDGWEYSSRVDRLPGAGEGREACEGAEEPGARLGRIRFQTVPSVDR